MSYHSGAMGWALLLTSQWMPGAQPGVSAELWLVSTGGRCPESVSGPTFGSDNKRLPLLGHVPSPSYHPIIDFKGNLCHVLGIQASYSSHGLPNATWEALPCPPREDCFQVLPWQQGVLSHPGTGNAL